MTDYQQTTSKLLLFLALVMVLTLCWFGWLADCWLRQYQTGTQDLPAKLAEINTRIDKIEAHQKAMLEQK